MTVRSGPDGLDLITVTGLAVRGHHGVFAHERENGQLFVVDLTLGLDLAPAAESGDLSRTIDYGTLSEGVKDAVSSDPVDLIETLAQRIVDVCLTYDLVQWVRVTVHKPEAPITVAFSDVAVTLERSRT